ncbi:MAG: protocatechuate 3,4-dioxygenase subunit alpha [Chloroflexota bacterium]
MAEPTPSQTVGPFFGYALPFEGGPNATAIGVRIEGQLLDGAGEPVPDGLIEVSQDGQFGRCGTDPEGVFHFVIDKPAPRLGQAPHLEVTVFARGLLRALATRMYFPEEAPANADDPVLELAGDRRETLVARADNGVLRFDIRLQGEGETVFFELPD